MTEETFAEACAVGGVERICVWGAGWYGRRSYRLLKACGARVDCFGDGNPALHGREVVDGILCQSAEDLLNAREKTLVLIAVKGAAAEIESNLAGQGFARVTRMESVEGRLTRELSEFIAERGADLVNYMAISGVGSELCLARDCLPVPVQFYQPIPNIADLERRDVWSKVSALKGLRWDESRFAENFTDIARYAPANDWLTAADGDSGRFHLDNTSFSYICASLLYGMIAKSRPRRVIEVGSGCSSRVIRQALREQELDAAYTIIDPYCALTVQENETIIVAPVEETDISLFERLEENDILFIDSSHVARIGGDVNFEILEILPRLAAGVLVHFHDIAMPREYLKVYAVNPQFRVFWTESYMLQAFLAFNDAYEIVLPAAWLCGGGGGLELIDRLWPNARKTNNWSSGSFWLRKKAET